MDKGTTQSPSSLCAMDRSLLLSACYFGSVEHYALMARSTRVVIDGGEHYERQSYRTRTTLIGPNGRQDLVASINRQSGVKMPMHAVGLSYAEPWHLQHLQAIRSAYGQTPWFIHYMPDIEQLLLQRHATLFGLDLASMRMALEWLGLPLELETSTAYVEDATQLTDLRSTLHPKKPLPAGIRPVPAYAQVFADRHGFTGRLSIVDLVMNAGPDALRILQAT